MFKFILVDAILINELHLIIEQRINREMLFNNWKYF